MACAKSSSSPTPTTRKLLIDVGCAREARRAAIREWAEELRASMPEIAGVVAFREANPGDRKAAAPEILVTVGAPSLTYQDAASGLPRQCRILLSNQPPPHR